jgi:hypothetical protein
VDDWKNAISCVKEIQADYWARDHLPEEEIEHISVNFGVKHSDTNFSNDLLANDDADVGVSGTGINAVVFVMEKCAFLVLH